MSKVDLDETLSKLDRSNNYIEEETVIQELGKLIERLQKEGDNENSKLAHLNCEFLHFTKSIDRGISFRFAGTDEQGNQYEWPSLKNYTSFEFSYLKKRFDETSNPYLKSEFGLLLVLSNHPDSKQYKSNELVKSICDSLIELSKIYKCKVDNQEKLYDIYILNSLKNCIGVARQRKLNDYVDKVTNFVLIFLLSFQHENPLILDLLRLTDDYFLDFEERVELKSLLEHIWHICSKSDDSKVFLIIEIVKVALSLSNKISIASEKWEDFIASKYEFMAKESKEKKTGDRTFYLENADRKSVV